VRESAGRRSLTVGCIPSIASRWLVPNLADFSAAHPDIDLRVMYALAETNLAGSSLDVLVTYTGSGAGSGNGTRLLSRLSRPVASPHLLARTGPLDRPDRIAAAPLLHDETRDAWAAWFRTTGFEGASVRQGPVFQDFNLLASAAIAGHGIALCPVEVFRNEIARGDLVVLSDVATQEADHYVVITRPESEALAGPFVDWLLALVRDSGPGDSGFREPADFGENRASVRIR
jgi:DNA-binding transcriptional LysR family regulator